MSIEAMKLAIQALHFCKATTEEAVVLKDCAITSLNVALAEAESYKAAYPDNFIKPLTDDEIVQLAIEWPAETNDRATHIRFARVIEAKLISKE